MLSKDGVIARYILAFSFFFLSGSEMITGVAAPAAESWVR